MVRWLSNLDAALTARIYNKPAWLLPLMSVLSTAGHPLVIITICGLLALGAYIIGQVSVGLGFALCLVALALGGLLKGVLKRERPTSPYAGNMRVKSFSFPSGHALGTLVFYGYVSVLTLLFLPQIAPVGVLVCAILVLLTGLARVYLGAHYVGDVLGGWLLGVVALAIILETSL
ncbi:MAG TPA: phosphatase PAP2 family protein [Candidatus Saccharimonadales bacterium]